MEIFSNLFYTEQELRHLQIVDCQHKLVQKEIRQRYECLGKKKSEIYLDHLIRKINIALCISGFKNLRKQPPLIITDLFAI